MSKKFTIQLVSALVILAALLIFLGVNFVPRIFASQSAQNNSIVSGIKTRPDYLDEHNARAILDSRNPSSISLTQYYKGTDYYERHPSTFYENSDYFQRHPSTFYDNSDYFQRHPSK